jgi:CHRD domain-containing protein
VRSRILMLAAVLSTGAAAVVVAQNVERLRTLLNGYEEPPAISTVATGSFEARIDEEAMEIRYRLSYANLETPAAQAHIHFGQHRTSGGISAWLCGNPPLTVPPDIPLCPPTTGTVTGVITPADVIGPAGQGIEPGSFEELVRAIRAGVTYANVHSTRFPAGEIRGQIPGDHDHGNDKDSDKDSDDH